MEIIGELRRMGIVLGVRPPQDGECMGGYPKRNVCLMSICARQSRNQDHENGTFDG